MASQEVAIEVLGEPEPVRQTLWSTHHGRPRRRRRGRARRRPDRSRGSWRSAQRHAFIGPLPEVVLRWLGVEAES
jgi:hypothetical protein